MNDWLPILHRRLQDETALVRVVVATVRGSAPREPGACMLVGRDRIDGTIGGGHLELKATGIARHMLAQPAAPTRLDRFALGATLGQCCGGSVNLWFEHFDATDLGFIEAALEVCSAGEAAVMVSSPHECGSVARSLYLAKTSCHSTNELQNAAVAPAVAALLGAPPHASRAVLARAGNREALIERIDAEGIPLWIFGAGHVGRALVKTLADLPFQVNWIDSREGEFPADVASNVRVRHAADPVAMIDTAPAGACFLVLTHSHDLDYAICRAILKRGDFAWAGLIGSETKAACFNLRFGREDIPAHSVARLVSPIGIHGIDSKLPAAIAISVAAQLLQVAQAAEQRNANPAVTLLTAWKTS
jgi:xanthine dehydrogenase accessory factor